MHLKYNINKENYKISFCTKNNEDFIISDLKKLSSDNRVLFLYDKNINEKLIRRILDNLKLSGCNIFVMRIEGNKINKNEKLLFKIIDNLIANKFTKKSVIISCGGGVVGDVSALASSLYLRGLIYFHIPTTIDEIYLWKNLKEPEWQNMKKKLHEIEINKRYEINRDRIFLEEAKNNLLNILVDTQISFLKNYFLIIL